MSMQFETEFTANGHLTQYSDSIYHVFEESNLDLEAVLAILRTKGELDD